MILYLNAEKNNQKGMNKKDYLLAAAQRMGIEYVQWYTQQPDPEYVLNIEPFDHFIKGSKWTGIWEIDLLCDRPELSDSNWAVCDTVFIAVSALPRRVEHMRDKTTLLFQAADPVIHKRYSDVSPEFDFVFCGTADVDWYEERQKMIRLLRNTYTFKDFFKGHTPQEYARNLNKGRVQVVRSMKSNIAEGELAQRFFESLAIGPVLVNYVPDLLETGLIEGRDYFSYTTFQELSEKMAELITHPDRAAVMAENGRKKALAYHMYENRLVTILNTIHDFNYYSHKS